MWTIFELVLERCIGEWHLHFKSWISVTWVTDLSTIALQWKFDHDKCKVWSWKLFTRSWCLSSYLVCVCVCACLCEGERDCYLVVRYLNISHIIWLLIPLTFNVVIIAKLVKILALWMKNSHVIPKLIPLMCIRWLCVLDIWILMVLLFRLLNIQICTSKVVIVSKTATHTHTHTSPPQHQQLNCTTSLSYLRRSLHGR